jgi:hypothetical protein
MPREKAPKPDTLANAHKALREAMQNYSRAVTALDLLIDAKDHQAALDGYELARQMCILSKDALNGMYRHLAELKPAPVKKPPRKEKAEAATGPKEPGPGVKGPTQVEDRRKRKGAEEDDPFDGQGEDVADPPRDNREDDDDRDAP